MTSRQVRSQRNAAPRERARPPGPGPGSLTAAGILALQRSAGNRAVARQVKIGRPTGTRDVRAAAAKGRALRAARDPRAVEHYLALLLARNGPWPERAGGAIPGSPSISP